MKSKPIINESNFPKVQKQPLFIVRPKPSQTKFQQSLFGNRQMKGSVVCETLQKSLEQCLSYLEHQINEEQVMEKVVCLRIKEHLLTLKQKYVFQQQSQNRKEVETPHVLIRKQSSKYLAKQKIQTNEDHRSKENFTAAQYYLQDNIKNQVTHTKSNKDESQAEIRTLQVRVKHLNDRLQEYEHDYQSLGLQLRTLQTDLEKQLKEKSQLKSFFQKKIQQNKVKQDCLGQQLFSLNQKLSGAENRVKATIGCLKERESQIITLWQLFAK